MGAAAGGGGGQADRREEWSSSRRGQREMGGRLSGDISTRAKPCSRTLPVLLVASAHPAAFLPTYRAASNHAPSITDLGCGPRDEARNCGLDDGRASLSRTRPRTPRQARRWPRSLVRMAGNSTTVRGILSVMWAVPVPPPPRVPRNRYVPRVRSLLISAQRSVCFRRLDIRPILSACLGVSGLQVPQSDPLQTCLGIT